MTHHRPFGIPERTDRKFIHYYTTKKNDKERER
jgi:hypothetical protein